MDECRPRALRRIVQEMPGYVQRIEAAI
jgi:hypothetical protein